MQAQQRMHCMTRRAICMIASPACGYNIPKTKVGPAVHVQRLARGALLYCTAPALASPIADHQWNACTFGRSARACIHACKTGAIIEIVPARYEHKASRDARMHGSMQRAHCNSQSVAGSSSRLMLTDSMLEFVRSPASATIMIGAEWTPVACKLAVSETNRHCAATHTRAAHTKIYLCPYRHAASRSRHETQQRRVRREDVESLSVIDKRARKMKRDHLHENWDVPGCPPMRLVRTICASSTTIASSSCVHRAVRVAMVAVLCETARRHRLVLTRRGDGRADSVYDVGVEGLYMHGRQAALEMPSVVDSRFEQRVYHLSIGCDVR
eukprot:IDg17831t1